MGVTNTLNPTIMNFTIKKVDVKKGGLSARRNEPYRYNHKIYIHAVEETIFDNLANRRNRPYEHYKEGVLPKVLEYLKENEPDVYLAFEGAKIGWRQKCGCTCPCSPGFIVARNGHASWYSPYDIYVHIGNA